MILPGNPLTQLSRPESGPTQYAPSDDDPALGTSVQLRKQHNRILSLERADIGDRPIAAGMHKEIYAVLGHPDLVVAMPRKGGAFLGGREKLDEEVSVIRQLERLGFPVVTVHGVIPVGEDFAIVMDKIEGAKSSKEPGLRAVLNSRSVKDLRKIEAILRDQDIHINDLEFLVSKDGRVVIADPRGVGDGLSDRNVARIRNLLALCRDV